MWSDVEMLRSIVITILLAAFAAIPCATAQKERLNFVPPRIAFAGDIAYPDLAASGMVQLSVEVNADGYVKSIHTVRDIPSLTSALAEAVQGWTFTPAFRDGAAVDSSIAIYAVFNPGVLPNKAITLIPLSWQLASEHPAYISPEITSAWDATYPANAPGGDVVLDLSVNTSGTVVHSAAVYNVPALTNSVISAANLWKFTPGTFHGTCIFAHAVAAFVFREPTIKRAS